MSWRGGRKCARSLAELLLSQNIISDLDFKKSHKAKQSKKLERHGGPYTLLCVRSSFQSRFETDHLGNQRKWDENLQELEEHYGWGQGRMGLLGASLLTLFWGDLREPWRPRQPEGTLTMQECVPVFSDLGFFQGNMEIEILCEVL